MHTIDVHAIDVHTIDVHTIDVHTIDVHMYEMETLCWETARSGLTCHVSVKQSHPLHW